MCDFKPGDKFIRKSPRGTIITGEVKKITKTFVIDDINQLIYEKFNIITTNDVTYCVDGSDGIINKISKHGFDGKLKEMIDYFKNKSDEKNILRTVSQNNINIQENQ